MQVTKTKWNRIWSQEVSFLGLLFFNDAEKKAMNTIKKKLVPNSRIVDIGCGSGRALSLIAKKFSNSIGLDYSEMSIKISKNKGLTVLKRNAGHTGFKKKSFDLVFSEGLLEHYSDMSPIVNEMCRISKEYILLIQPNPKSLMIPFRALFYKIFRRRYAEEIPYTILDYSKQFEKQDFILVERKRGILNLFDILLFKKKQIKNL